MNKPLLFLRALFEGKQLLITDLDGQETVKVWFRKEGDSINDGEYVAYTNALYSETTNETGSYWLIYSTDINEWIELAEKQPDSFYEALYNE